MTANDIFNQYISEYLSPNIVWFLMFILIWTMVIINSFLIYLRVSIPTEEDLTLPKFKFKKSNPPKVKPKPKEKEPNGHDLDQFEMFPSFKMNQIEPSKMEPFDPNRNQMNPNEFGKLKESRNLGN